MTVTERVWFLRHARAIRCSSLAGFHGRSTFTHAAAVGGQKQPASRILLESHDLGAPTLLRHRPRMPRRLHAHLGCELAHQLEHALPLGEHDDLAIRLFEEVAQNAFELLELRTDAAGRIE